MVMSPIIAHCNKMINITLDFNFLHFPSTICYRRTCPKTKLLFYFCTIYLSSERTAISKSLVGAAILFIKKE